MGCTYQLESIYKELSMLKYKLFCNNECHKKECEILHHLILPLVEEKPSCNNSCDDKHKHDKYKNLIDRLLEMICHIENETKCNKNYGYLLQLERFMCLVENLKRLLCQLKCFCTKDCSLIGETLCLLVKILELIANIISKINNIECLCNTHLCCKCDILECLICMLLEDITTLEDSITDLAHLVLEIASQNIINCTTCTTSRYSVHKRRDYLNELCESHSSNCNCYNPKSIKYHK